MKDIYLEKFDTLFSNGDTSSSCLKDILARNDTTILYFYPKDNTPGCSVEAKDFTCLKDKFKDLGIEIVGVSKDSIDSHKEFTESQGLSLDLICDPDLILHKHFGAYGEKNNYGKIVTGVIRSTFLIGKDLNILKSWKNVRAKSHAEKIFKEIKVD